jgi:hypothetical protein
MTKIQNDQSVFSLASGYTLFSKFRIFENSYFDIVSDFVLRFSNLNTSMSSIVLKNHN